MSEFALEEILALYDALEHPGHFLAFRVAVGVLPVSAKLCALRTRLGLVLSLDDVDRQFMHRVR